MNLKKLSFLLLLLFFKGEVKCETADAVYRDGVFFNITYHAALMAGYNNETGIYYVIHSAGGSSYEPNSVRVGTWSEFLAGNNFIAQKCPANFSKGLRDSILNDAFDQLNAHYWGYGPFTYCYERPNTYPGSGDGCFRCDFLVEWAYEQNGYDVCNDADLYLGGPAFQSGSMPNAIQTPPINVVMTYPSSVNSNSPTISSSSSITLRASATDTHSGLSFNKPFDYFYCEYVNGSWTSWQGLSSDWGTNNVTVSSANILYALQVRAFDNDGNFRVSPVYYFKWVPETTPPTVSITSPAANARFTNNAVVAVQGTAADNVQVAAVNCQLNGGGWSAATGTSNWQTTVSLVPGTNVFQVFSVDSSGNNSLTNSRNFVLVLTAPIVVQTNGVGTVSPNYDGQMLEVGKSYSMTATAGAGFMFTNWTGSVPTNGPTVKFIMASNLVLTANFVDVTKPTVSLTNAAKTYTNSQTVIIGATASDNVGVASVAFYDGLTLKGTNSTAPFGYGWTFTSADNGTHSWTARAYDTAGNISTSSAVTLIVSIDITPPTLAISSPASGANLTISPTNVSGTASDPDSPSSGLDRVEVRVNGGSWSNATGTTSWTRSVTLTNCGNTIEARSIDKAGNYSAIASNFVTYTPANTVPNTPTKVFPTAGARNVSVPPTLQASQFSDPDPVCLGDTHAASQWRVLTPGAVVVADSGTDTVNKVSWTVPAGRLYYGSNYQWEVRYRDSRNGWSSYSPRTFFTNCGPMLAGIKRGTNVVLNWPTNSVAFILQWSTNLGSAHWSNAAAPVIVNGQYAVTNNMTNVFKFYRLKK